MNIPPFANSAPGQEMFAAKTADPVLTPCGGSGFRTMFPDVQKRDKIGCRVLKKRMQPIHFRLLPGRPFPRVLHAERSRDHQNFRQATLFFRLEDHSGDSRIDRKPCHHPTAFRQNPRRDLAPCVIGFAFNRLQFLQGVDAVAYAFGQWAVDKREVADISKSEGEHSQHDAREVRTENLRSRVKRSAEILLLRVQPYAGTVLHPSATPFTLIGAAAGDPLHRESHGSGTGIVLRDAGQSGVHYIADPGNRQGCLRDVGGHHDFPQRHRMKNPLLLETGEA